MPIELPNITSEWIDKVLGVTRENFEELALQTYHFQYHNNQIYGQYARKVGCENVNSLEDIPFLPIRFFKSHKVTSTAFEPEAVFESSGTTQTTNSRHYVKDLEIYKKSFLAAFRQFYGDPADYCIIALLPSYLERKNSSLVVMADALIQMSPHKESGFYLYNHQELYNVLQQTEKRKQKTILIGVTFALLDFAEAFPMQLKYTIVMETGGMKGRREEWTRNEVQDFLITRLGLTGVHSEYGMTELLSQAYSKGAGMFECPPWMKIVLRAEDDPLSLSDTASGIINVIDLANIYSCSFIATDDAGKILPDGQFEITGRTDHSDLRGCSLMSL
jgi:hypothetical protein